MKVLFLAYANSTDNKLPTLEEEAKEVYSLLAPNALKQHYMLHRDSTATKEELSENIALFRNHIFLFSYSGHAEQSALLLEDDIARSDGIAHQLAQCPNLKVVLLNGCSTAGQVKGLQALGIPCVIATSAPINDTLATQFAIRFFQSLNERATIGEAFELASGEVLTTKAVVFQRGMVLPTNQSKAPLWGIFYPEEQAAVLKEQLPILTEIAIPLDYIPNQQLLNALMDVLAGYHRKVARLKEDEADGEEVGLVDKRMTILNALPAPIAEPLRKLLVPSFADDNGYDKININRLQKLWLTYNTTIEFLVFILLSEFWEATTEKKGFVGLPTTVKRIHFFLKLPKEDRLVYEYLPLIEAIRNNLQKEGVSFFVEEFKDLAWKDDFKDACLFFFLLARKIKDKAIAPHEVASLCIRAEKNLAAFFTQLGFMGKYTLAAIKDIDIHKYRHQPQPTFKHSVALLLNLLGGFEIKHKELNRFTDNKSVLLLKMKGKQILDELNLSPFIVDKNAFGKGTDLPKIYFLSHYQNGFKYKFINKVATKPLDIMQPDYQLIQAQLAAFDQLLQEKMKVL